MAVYTFYLHRDEEDDVPGFELELFERAEDALAHGRGLLAARPHYSAVTVAEGEAVLARLGRPAPGRLPPAVDAAGRATGAPC